MTFQVRMRPAAAAAGAAAPAPAAPARPAAPGHSTFEDLFAVVAATLMIGLAITLFKSAGLLTGGVAGLAFLVHYASGVEYGLVFFLLNLPFYWLALKRLGWPFTLKTFGAVGLLSCLVALSPKVLGIGAIHPAYASVVGGVLLGTGFLMLFRHKASLGGVGIVAVYLQERRGWRAGYVQMAFDATIVLCSLAIVDWHRLLWSIVGVVVLNLILSFNHRPGRYLAS